MGTEHRNDARLDIHTWTNDFRSRQFGHPVRAYRIFRRWTTDSTLPWIVAATSFSTFGQNSRARFEVILIAAHSIYRHFRNHHQFISVSIVHVASKFDIDLSVTVSIAFMISFDCCCCPFRFRIDYCCRFGSSMAGLSCGLGDCVLFPSRVRRSSGHCH